MCVIKYTVTLTITADCNAYYGQENTQCICKVDKHDPHLRLVFHTRETQHCAPRKILEPGTEQARGGWRNPDNEELQFHSPRNILRVMTSNYVYIRGRRIRKARYR
jgi:hypothetical protein